MEAAIPLLLLLGAVLAAPFVWFLINYNRFVTLRQHLRESWSDIGVEMQRRYDLIPNLVETVKGYASHEEQVFRETAELRNQAMRNHGSATEQAVDESALEIGVGRLLAVAEGYPELKADTHFLALQRELSNTEDRIAASRRFYNGNVRELNELREQFPASLVAGVMGVERASYFELTSEAARRAPGWAN
ncbi:LemA family protein [Pseudobythopirellula maris]|uniref:LemA family protein n=1 Tax=Pseudobythopirellula maris TaxID=2527991 RepID=A0A5C5ZP15_9BACT|nr:LemA family protein [Pseudobythopirellula maris]TWT88886.1 LemA family protein [Pseudobythopirellula maris]